MLIRTLYVIIGALLGSLLLLMVLSKDFAKNLSNNLALTYYRSCTISVAYVVNKNQLSNKVRQDGYKNCINSSQTFYNILKKSL